MLQRANLIHVIDQFLQEVEITSAHRRQQWSGPATKNGHELNVLEGLENDLAKAVELLRVASLGIAKEQLEKEHLETFIKFNLAASSNSVGTVEESRDRDGKETAASNNNKKQNLDVGAGCNDFSSPKHLLVTSLAPEKTPTITTGGVQSTEHSDRRQSEVDEYHRSHSERVTPQRTRHSPAVLQRMVTSILDPHQKTSPTHYFTSINGPTTNGGGIKTPFFQPRSRTPPSQKTTAVDGFGCRTPRNIPMTLAGHHALFQSNRATGYSILEDSDHKKKTPVRSSEKRRGTTGFRLVSNLSPVYLS